MTISWPSEGNRGKQMPNAILMSKLHQGLDPARLRELLASEEERAARVLDKLAERGGLVDVLHELVGLEVDERAYLESIPSVLREAMAGAALQAFSEDKALFVHYSPGYDFEVRLMDYGRAVSLHLVGPYPPYPRAGYVEG